MNENSDHNDFSQNIWKKYFFHFKAAKWQNLEHDRYNS